MENKEKEKSLLTIICIHVLQEDNFKGWFYFKVSSIIPFIENLW